MQNSTNPTSGNKTARIIYTIGVFSYIGLCGSIAATYIIVDRIEEMGVRGIEGGWNFIFNAASIFLYPFPNDLIFLAKFITNNMIVSIVIIGILNIFFWWGVRLLFYKIRKKSVKLFIVFMYIFFSILVTMAIASTGLPIIFLL